MDKKKTKKKKSGNLLNVALFLTVAIAVFAVVYVYRVFFADAEGVGTEIVKGFNSQKEAEATKIYNRIMSYDLEKVYPQKAEDVMRLYNDTVYILYGNMITDEELAMEVLGRQRKLCSDELINGLGIDEQFINLNASLDILKEQSLVCLGIEEKTIKYDAQDKRICTVSVKMSFTNGITVYRNYILFNNEAKGRWEVYSWEQTDENFNPKVF